MSDTITRFTVTDRFDGQAPEATHTIHLPVRPHLLPQAVNRLRDLTARYGVLTGAYVGGDSWQAWCEPLDPDERFTVLHVDVTIPDDDGGTGSLTRTVGRMVAVDVTGQTAHLISLAGDWNVQ